ncbi:MAG: hypothetical protein J3K34DRAFT_526052 [Monoraphidium minutum]|nr:MAG: hypothetical protein J3K34DRAFT_526052 [Monoraphidium minutum]
MCLASEWSVYRVLTPGLMEGCFDGSDAAPAPGGESQDSDASAPALPVASAAAAEATLRTLELDGPAPAPTAGAGDAGAAAWGVTGRAAASTADAARGGAAAREHAPPGSAPTAEQDEDADRHSRTLFFAKVAPSASCGEVSAVFEPYGQVAEVNLFRAWATARSSKGCGLITMATAEGARAARDALSGKHVWEGADAPMAVEWCCPTKLGAKAASTAATKAAAAAERAAVSAAAAAPARGGGGGGARRRGAPRQSASFSGPSGAGRPPRGDAPYASAAAAAAHQTRLRALAAANAGAVQVLPWVRPRGAAPPGGGGGGAGGALLFDGGLGLGGAGPGAHAGVLGSHGLGPVSSAPLLGGQPGAWGLLCGGGDAGGGGGAFLAPADVPRGGSFSELMSGLSAPDAGCGVLGGAAGANAAAVQAAMNSAPQLLADAGTASYVYLAPPAAPAPASAPLALGSPQAGAPPPPPPPGAQISDYSWAGCDLGAPLACGMAGLELPPPLPPAGFAPQPPEAAAMCAFPAAGAALAAAAPPPPGGAPPHGRLPQIALPLTPAQAQALSAHIATLMAATGCAVGLRPAAAAGGWPQLVELVATGTPPQLQSAGTMVSRLLRSGHV